MKSGFEQAVYAILLLYRCPDDLAMPIERLSSAMNVSPSYLQKLMRKLVQYDLIVSVPGAKGGFRLNPKCRDITLYDIYVAMEGRQPMFSPNGVFQRAFSVGKEHECILAKAMSEAENRWIEKLKAQTIAGLDIQIQQTEENKNDRLFSKSAGL